MSYVTLLSEIKLEEKRPGGLHFTKQTCQLGLILHENDYRCLIFRIFTFCEKFCGGEGPNDFISRKVSFFTDLYLSMDHQIPQSTHVSYRYITRN